MNDVQSGPRFDLIPSYCTLNTHPSRNLSPRAYTVAVDSMIPAYVGHTGSHNWGKRRIRKRRHEDIRLNCMTEVTLRSDLVGILQKRLVLIQTTRWGYTSHTAISGSLNHFIVNYSLTGCYKTHCIANDLSRL